MDHELLQAAVAKKRETEQAFGSWVAGWIIRIFRKGSSAAIA